MTPTDIKREFANCRTSPLLPRDPVAFLIGFASAFRLAELVAIDWLHVCVAAASVTIHVPSGKLNKA